MKKIIAIAAAIALVATFGAGMAFAGSNTSNGVPAQKTSVGYYSIDYTPQTNQWVEDTQLGDIYIHTPSNYQNSLIISFTGEADLITDAKLSGSGSSTSYAGIYVQARVDGEPIAIPDMASTSNNETYDPGGVVLNYRLVNLSGTLWEPSDNMTLFGQLPPQYIETYEHTRSANGFNFIVPDVGGGTHDITIWYYVDTGNLGISATKSAGAVVGKRTVVVEDDNLN